MGHIDDRDDDDLDFESYLKEKACRLQDASALRTVEIPEEKEAPQVETVNPGQDRRIPTHAQSLVPRPPTYKPADDVLENLRKSTKEETSEPTQDIGPRSALDAGERTSHFSISRQVLPSGATSVYVLDERVPLVLDEQGQAIINKTVSDIDKAPETFINDIIKATFTSDFAVIGSRSEAVIKHFHNLDRCIQLIKFHQIGLRAGLSEMLKAETTEERLRLLDIDSKFYQKQARKASEKIKGERAPKGPAKSKGSKSPGMKAADTLLGMMMSKAASIELLKTQGKWDSSVEAYVNKLSWKA